MTDQSSDDGLAALMFEQSEIKLVDELGEITAGRFKGVGRADCADEQIVVAAIEPRASIKPGNRDTVPLFVEETQVGKSSLIRWWSDV